MTETTTAIPLHLSLALITETPVNLPTAVIMPVSGSNLIGKLDETAIEKARAIALATNPLDPAVAQTFGSDIQSKLTQHLDGLLAATVTHEAGKAGDLLAEVATGVSMVRLDKLKTELERGTGILGRLFGGFSAFKALRARHQEILQHFSTIEHRAIDTRAQLLDDDVSGNLTVEILGEALDALEYTLVGGEAAWAKALSNLGEAPADARGAAAWNDQNETLKMFQTRLAKLAVVYVDSIKAIAEIRSAQQAGRIEVQNIADVLTITIPRLKRAIVQLVAARNIQGAQKDFQANQKLSHDIQRATQGAVADAYLQAKTSQGSVLEDVKVLGECVDSFSAMIVKGKEIDSENARRLKEAQAGLIKVKEGLAKALGQNL